MKKQIFIQQGAGVIDFAVLEDGLLVEMHSEKQENSILEGDIYLGKISKFLGGINSAFVDIGEEKNGFLHYSDLPPTVGSLKEFTKKALSNSSLATADLKDFKLAPLTTKDGKINTIFQRNDFIPVQVSKEPISTKGARLTSEISLAGRFIILIPFNPRGVSISKKIVDTKERKRLQQIVEKFKHPLFTIILRTAAQNVKQKEIEDDIRSTVAIWKTVVENIKDGGAKVKKIYSENQRIISFLRDYLSDQYDQIVVNDRTIYNNILQYLKKINSPKLDIVQFSDHTNLFDQNNVTKQIRAAFSTKVPLQSGGHLVIQKTEAMHVIDVNSGFKVFSEDQDKNAFENNMMAAKEVCRQIKLRDLGGIIVVDFIDMKNADYRKDIFELIKDTLAKDKTSSKVLPLSKFGILQITRQRTRPEIAINTSEKCVMCNGTGKMDSHALNIEEEIGKTIDYLFSLGHKKLYVEVNPIVYAYLTQGMLFSILNKWRWKFKRPINLKKFDSIALTMFKIFDEKKAEIVLS